MYENKKIREVHATRFIMSWVRSGGQLNNMNGYGDFYDWLKALELLEEEIDCIMELAHCGRLELEESAKKFIKDNITK